MALLHGSPSIYSNSTCISTYMYTRFRPQNKQKQIKSNGIQPFFNNFDHSRLEEKKKEKTIIMQWDLAHMNQKFQWDLNPTGLLRCESYDRYSGFCRGWNGPWVLNRRFLGSNECIVFTTGKPHDPACKVADMMTNFTSLVQKMVWFDKGIVLGKYQQILHVTYVYIHEYIIFIYDVCVYI